MKSTLYQDYDALAYKPHNLGEERGAINHIKKTKQKTKGLEIVFDPKGHKEFVTGFRKRKQQRRKVANQQLEKKAKQQRLESRAERRKEMKHQLGLPEDYGIADSDGEQGGSAGGGDDVAAAAAAAKSEVKQYQQAGYTTTVSITNFNAGYDDSDDEPAEAADSGDGDDNQANLQQQQLHRQQQPHSKHSKHKSSVKHGNVGKKTGSKAKSSKKHHGGKGRKK